MDIQKKIDAALAALARAEAKSFLRDPAAEISMKMAAITLADYKYPNLPEDYEALMRRAYGIIGPYFTLLNIGGVETAGGRFQPGIPETSDAFNKTHDGDAPRALVLGLLSGGAVLIYKDGKYHVVDESTHDVFFTYDDIADFIIDTVTRKDKAVRETSTG